MNTLHVLPYLDSDEMAESRRRELDIPRSLAAMLGASAFEAARAGVYVTDDGGEIDWRGLVEAARSGKRSIPPGDALPQPEGVIFEDTRVQVANETTLVASRRFTESGLRPLALNFANGINPGGGFLSGARAQEEVLCRSSALHATLEGDEMYAAHLRRELPDSTDWAILSPRVPVFREDDGTTLDESWLLDFITSAAPYAPGVGHPESGELLKSRIHRVLEIARAHGYSALVLGAWGCGAFGNDPLRTAGDFRAALEGEFAGAFSDVVFAITDWSAERRTLGPFRDVFEGA